MAIPYSVPALPKLANRYTRTRGDRDRNAAGNEQPGITKPITFLAQPQLVIILENMDVFSTEAYTFRVATNLQTPANNAVVTQYQLVAFGEGPGFGADLTKLINQEPGKGINSVNAVEFAVYDDPSEYVTGNPQLETGQSSTNTLGRTAGKYVLFAGFDEEGATEQLNYIFQLLDGGRRNG